MKRLLLILLLLLVCEQSVSASMRFGSRSIRDTVKESNTVSTISQQSGCPDAANTGEVHYTDTAESFDCDGDADFTFTESTNSVDMNGQLAVGATATTDQNVNHSFYNGISAIEEELVMLSETFTGTTNRNFGVLSEVILNPTGTSEVNSYGLASDIYVLSTNAQNITGALIGVIGAVENDGTGTLTTGIGVQGIVSRIGSDGDGTITRKIGGHFRVGTQTPTNATVQIGVGIDDDTITTSPIPSAPGGKIGLMIEPMDRGAASANVNVANIYSFANGRYDDAHNIFNGAVQIGVGSDQAIQLPAVLFIKAGEMRETGVGTISSSGTAVTGTGTAFTDDNLGKGTFICNGSNCQMVVSVASDTALTTEAAFSPVLSGATYVFDQPMILGVFDGSYNPAGDAQNRDFIITPDSRVGIRTSIPATALEVNGTITATGLTLNGAQTTTGNLTIQKADPTLIYDVVTATDTDFWTGVQDDAGSDDDDTYQIGKGTTPGTTTLVTITGGGLVGIGVAPTLGILHVDKGTGVGQATLDGSTGGCLMLRDTDDAGWTECDALDGVLTCSIDADGVCD